MGIKLVGKVCQSIHPAYVKRESLARCTSTCVCTQRPWLLVLLTGVTKNILVKTPSCSNGCKSVVVNYEEPFNSSWESVKSKAQVSKPVFDRWHFVEMWILPRSWMVSLPLCHHIFDDFIFWRWHQFDENHIRQAESQFRMDLFLTKGFELNTFRSFFVFRDRFFGSQRFQPVFSQRPSRQKKSHRNQFHSLFANHRQYKAPFWAIFSHQPRELKATNLGSWKPPTSGVEVWYQRFTGMTTSRMAFLGQENLFEKICCPSF